MDASFTIAARLKSARMSRGWTIEDLALKSGVSRAMISKIERGEASPTAATLALLAAGLSTSVASLFTDDTIPFSPLARADEHAVWIDPQSGYQRRNVSPSAARGSAEIVDVYFPAGARVLMENHVGWHGITQQIWMLEGEMELTIGEDVQRLATGDCLFMQNDQPVTFFNPGRAPARYAVILSRPNF
jgi:transcriptional regulator with XRE-family HTH domain